MDLAPVGLHGTVSRLGTSIALCLPYGDVNVSTASALWTETSLKQPVSLRYVMVHPQHHLLVANIIVNLECKRMVGQLGGLTCGTALPPSALCNSDTLKVHQSLCGPLAGHFSLQHIY